MLVLGIILYYSNLYIILFSNIRIFLYFLHNLSGYLTQTEIYKYVNKI